MTAFIFMDFGALMPEQRTSREWENRAKEQEAKQKIAHKIAVYGAYGAGALAATGDPLAVPVGAAAAYSEVLALQAEEEAKRSREEAEKQKQKELAEAQAREQREREQRQQREFERGLKESSERVLGDRQRFIREYRDPPSRERLEKFSSMA